MVKLCRFVAVVKCFIGLPDTPTDVLAVILQLPVIFNIKMGRIDQEVSSSPVAGCGNIVKHCDAQQCLYIHIMGLRLHGIPEENKDVNLALCYKGTQL